MKAIGREQVNIGDIWFFLEAGANIWALFIELYGGNSRKLRMSVDRGEVVRWDHGLSALGLRPPEPEPLQRDRATLRGQAT
jgi:hypothetical protein